MSAIETLENKVNTLIKLLKDQKEENGKLKQENKILADQVKKLEDASQKQQEKASTLSQEKESTKQELTELIRIIDSFIETGTGKAA